MYWHLTFAPVGRARLWHTPAELAHQLRSLARICRSRLLLFWIGDDHGHTVVAGDRAEAGAMARRQAQVYGAAGRSVAPVHIRPVEGRDHLVTLVEYVLRQAVRHDLGVHPAAWPGGCFPDLIGARVLPGFDRGAVARALPRVDEGRFWRAVDLPPRQLVLDPEEIRSFGARALVEGAAAALAVDPEGHDPDAVDARAAAARLALGAGVRPAWFADELGVSDRMVRRLRVRPIAPEREAAVRAQLALRVALRSASPATPRSSEQRAIARSRLQHGDPWVGGREPIRPA